MDLLKFQASLDAHTQALLTHSAALEKFMSVAASGGAAQTGEATAARGRGRPTNAEKAAAQAATAATPSGTVSTTVTASPQTNALAASVAQTAAQTVNAAQATASAGPLTHQSLAPKFMAFAKAKGRDAAVALLGEFGAAEFAKVPVDQLNLFSDRLDGKPQTPTIAADLGNLLGM